MNRLRNVIRRWLGLGETIIGVDVGIKDESCIVVISRLDGGAVKIIDARLGSAIEVRRFIKECQRRYGVQDRDTVVDYPW